MGEKARAAAASLRRMTTAEKNATLENIAKTLEADREAIAAANAADVAASEAAGLSTALVDRLKLTESRFREMVGGVRKVASLPDPVGETIWTRDMPSGIRIEKRREPFGVVAVVFESRPNVFIDTAALCLKTGNAIILRGGKEAVRSNAALAASVAGGDGKADRKGPRGAKVAACFESSARELGRTANSESPVKRPFEH